MELSHWDSLPPEILGMIGSYLTPGDVYTSLQVCQGWYRTLYNSHLTWRSQRQQLGFVTYPGDEEHPRDKCKRLLALVENFQQHVSKTSIKLEDLVKAIGKETVSNYKVFMAYIDEILVTAGDSMMAVCCRTGTFYSIAFI